jgi:hypothetical protein
MIDYTTSILTHSSQRKIKKLIENKFKMKFKFKNISLITTLKGRLNSSFINFIRELLSLGKIGNRNPNRKIKGNKSTSNTALYQQKRYQLIRLLKVLYGFQDQDVKLAYIKKNLKYSRIELDRNKNRSLKELGKIKIVAHRKNNFSIKVDLAKSVAPKKYKLKKERRKQYRKHKSD